MTDKRALMRAMRMAAGAVLVAGALVLGAGAAGASPKEDKAMTVTGTRYGFRHDPMEFARNDQGVQGAMVRTFVLKKPQSGDKAILQKRIDEILTELKADGSLGDDRSGGANKLNELIDLGADSSRPEMQKAANWAQSGEMHLFAVRALCRMGRGSRPEVLAWLKGNSAKTDQWIATGCPWTPEMSIQSLWAGRKSADTKPAVEKGLAWIKDNMNDAGCLSYWEPFGMLDCAGDVDLPAAREIVKKQVPMILRAQAPDGGWGNNSYKVFRALSQSGLLEPLRKLPALPADWEIVRSIPTPESDLDTLAWDGARFWLFDKRAGSAIAVSPEDGKVLQTVKVPAGKSFGVFWWDGSLGVSQMEPKRLLKLDTATGATQQEVKLDKLGGVLGAALVDGKLWVTDCWMTPGVVLDPADPKFSERLEGRVAGPGPVSFAPANGGVWQTDFWAPAIIKSGPGGKLADWGEKPFEHLGGLAWDGNNLWALDTAAKKICLIQHRP